MEAGMSDILVRNLDPDLKRRLVARAKANKRSLSGEVQEILARTLAPALSPVGQGRGLGTKLVDAFRAADAEGLFNYQRDPGMRPPPDFE
jgi:plasmid stability protein